VGGWPSPEAVHRRRRIEARARPRAPTYSNYAYAAEFSYRLETEEEALAAVMTEIGPMVAIGRPGEELPELGAYRIYVPRDKDWREEVSNYISAAQLVILRLSETKGLLWELRTAIQHGEAKRLLLLVPWEQSDYEAFRKEHATEFPAGLPEYGASDSNQWVWFPGKTGSLRGVICFWPDWTPHFLPLKGSFLYKDTIKVVLKRALIPVFNRLGLAYKPLTIPWGKKFILLIVGILGIIGGLMGIGMFLYETLSSLGAILRPLP
jgi:hypothetical protein